VRSVAVDQVSEFWQKNPMEPILNNFNNDKEVEQDYIPCTKQHSKDCYENTNCEHPMPGERPSE